MRNWLRRWLGVRGLERRVSSLELEKQTQPLPLLRPEDIDDVAGEGRCPPEVEAMVSFMWKDAPQAAASTRTYARSMLASGVRPETVARLVREHGVVIE